MLCGRHGEAIGGVPHFFYVAFNMFYKPLPFSLPVLPRGMSWNRLVDTALASPDDICVSGAEQQLAIQKQYVLREWSGVVLVGK